MKTALVLFAIMPCVALAAGYGGAQGTNKRGEIIRIGGDVADTIYVQKNAKDSEWKESYVLRDECPSFLSTFEGKKQFSCRKNSQSPLAGTTYRVTTSKKYQPCNEPPFNDKSPGEIYVCIGGCDNPRAPKTFIVSPWECA
ncbi:MAG: hypothetical protein ACYCZA_09635 [Thiobacillus sp.]